MHTDLAARQPGRLLPAVPERIVRAALLAGGRFGAVALQFLLQIVVGALAGAAGIGILQLLMSWTGMLGECIARGLPPWAMRLAAVNGPGREAETGGALRDASRRILHTAALACLAASAALLLLGGSTDPVHRLLALAVLLASPLHALLRLFAESLKGAGLTIRAVTLESAVIPLCLLVVCGACALAEITLDAPLLLVAGIAGTGAALLVVVLALPAGMRPSNGHVAGSLPRSGDLNALWAASLLSIAFLQLPFLLMPWFAPLDAVGAYAVAHKLLNIATTLLILLAALFGPAFARAAAAGDTGRLRGLLFRTQALSCAIFLPVAAGLLLFSAPLAALFSIPADDLHLYLVLLAAGQFINALTGLAGVLLNMSGGARREIGCLAAAIAIALAGAPLVGPLHGAPGLAVLFSVALAVKNIASFALAHRHLANLESLP